MRHVKRYPASDSFTSNSKALSEKLQHLENATLRGETIREDLYVIKKEISDATLGDARHQFHSKCAYCESVITDLGSLDWFRPAFGADRMNGHVDQTHYSWLVATWENIYLCCAECNSYKKNAFPIGRKSSFGATLAQLRKSERALLIDPCFDYPEKHFEVGRSGQLIAITTRAQATIQILNLNRDSLLKNRRHAIEHFFALWEYCLLDQEIRQPGLVDRILQFLAPSAPYAGVIFLYLFGQTHGAQRAVLRRIASSEATERHMRGLINSIGTLLTPDQLSDSRSIASAWESGNSQEWADLRPIKTLRINGFKGITNLTIDFPIESGIGGHSLAIVGQNATGKSTVLQALALALIGPEEANRVIQDARTVISEGASNGSIRVTFWGDNRTNTLEYHIGSQHFSGETELRVRVYGYGPYRLLAKGPLPRKKRGLDYRLKSLFHDGEPINGFNGWLNKLNAPRRRDLAEILQLLLASIDTKVRVNPKNLEISTNGKSHPLHSLSSGMQSVVSMCTDVAEALYARGDSTLVGGYVLLVDELDAHLHPSWRMGIVKRLNKAFPNAHLIFSTHDPLTLRGLSSEQVQILRRENDGIHVRRADWYSDALDIDQILTSDIFGLFDTRAPEWEASFNEYYKLLNQEECGPELSDIDKLRLETLRKQLGASGILGKTKRERLMFAVIDKFLANSISVPDEWNAKTIAALTASVRKQLGHKDTSLNNRIEGDE